MALTKEQKNSIKEKFAQSANDSGSVELQVALLTTDIKQLTEHCKVNHKDHSSRRGLLKKVCRRKRFLKYLMNKDVNKYRTIVQQLGLRK